MAEVGNSEIAPKLETPTEASRGFLGQMVHGARETGMTIVAGLTPGGPIGLAFRRERLASEAQMAQAGLTTKPESQPEPEVRQQTPTKASESFMQSYWHNELKPILNQATKFPAALVTETVGIGVINGLGGINIAQDMAEGRWAVAAAKGVIAGVMAVPFVRFIKS